VLHTTIPRPDGYPELALAPKPALPAGTPGATARAVERVERSWGNGRFQLRHLSALPTPVGRELASVYVALRQRFPAARPDVVDLAARQPSADILGVTYTYGDLIPSMRPQTSDRPISPRDAVRRFTVPQREVDAAAGVRDTTAAGCIEISDVFSTVGGYARASAAVAENEVRRVLAGRDPEPAVCVTLPTAILIHEFGHLVEAALADIGFEALEPAFAALSTTLLGNDNPKTSQWRNHLVNYPELPGSLAGPCAGGPARRARTRAVLRRRVGAVLGRYAAVNRDELFAEAFTYALVGGDELRVRLSGFLTSVEDGLAQSP
jgi:hypothetical protein